MVAKLRSLIRRHLVATVAVVVVLAAGTASAATNAIEGHGIRKQARFVVPATASGFLSTPKVIATIPGMGTLKLIACFDDSGSNSVREQFVSSTGTTLDVLVDSVSWQLPSGPATVSMEGSGRIVGSGSGTVRAVSAPGSTVGSSGRMTWQISSGAGGGAGAHVATITSTILNRSPITDQCDVAADILLP